MKHRTDPRQAGQSADRPNSVFGVTSTARPQARSVSHKVLYAASVFFLLQSMGALGIINRSVYGEWAGKTGNKITLTVNLLAITVSLFLFWSGTQATRIARFNRVLPLAAASLLLISVLWSVDPRVTLTQGTAYLFLVLGAIGIVKALDSDVLMDLAASICALCAIASIVQFFIFPEPGDFRGIFPQKNLLGEAMAAGVLIALHGMRIRGARRFRCACIIALCTIVAFMSKSSTSILAIVVFCWLDILGRLYLKRGSAQQASICLALGSIAIAIFFAMDASLIFDLFGKTSTLSGRTLLWPHVIDAISEKSLLGWGFSAFWSLSNPRALQIAYAFSQSIDRNNWYVLIIPEAHNGMLEFLLQIGFLGTSFFIFLWVRNFVMAVKNMNGSAGQIGLSSVLLLIGILVIGVSETVLLAAQQVWTGLFFMMGFMCEKELWLARAARGQTMLTSRGRMHAPGRLGLSKGPVSP